MCGLGSDQKQLKSTAACASPVVKRLEFLPSPVPSEEAASNEKDVKKPEIEQQKEAACPAIPEVGTGKKEREWKTRQKRRRISQGNVYCANCYFSLCNVTSGVQGMTLEDGFCAKSCGHQGAAPPKELPGVCLQCLNL